MKKQFFNFIFLMTYIEQFQQKLKAIIGEEYLWWKYIPIHYCPCLKSKSVAETSLP